MRLGLILTLIVSILAGPAAADEAFWAAARADGVHLIMRHARAPGTGDPAGFRLDHCSTQRNLDAGGREQARRIGEAVREARIGVDVVLTSAWCRSSETATLLGLGPVRQEPSLDSFFQDRSEARASTDALRMRLAGLGDTKAMLVSHQVNITALTGVYPTSGEIVAIAVDEDGGVTVRGRLALR